MSVTVKLHEINKIRHSCYGYSKGTESIQRARSKTQSGKSYSATKEF